MNGWPAGTPIPNTVFEIYNYKTGKLVDTVKTDKNGIAVSKPLPLGWYKVVNLRLRVSTAWIRRPLRWRSSSPVRSSKRL